MKEMKICLDLRMNSTLKYLIAGTFHLPFFFV